jgi:hypothetical protein
MSKRETYYLYATPDWLDAQRSKKFFRELVEHYGGVLDHPQSWRSTMLGLCGVFKTRPTQQVERELIDALRQAGFKHPTLTTFSAWRETV